MRSLWNIKITLFLALIGMGLVGNLTACVFRDDGHGGHEEHMR